MPHEIGNLGLLNPVKNEVIADEISIEQASSKRYCSFSFELKI